MASSGSIRDDSIRVHDGSTTAEIIDQLIRIWAEENPAGNADHRKRLALRHTACDGFRCFAVACGGDVVGFAYGMYNGQGTGLNGPEQVSSLGSHDLLDEWTAKGAPGNPWISPDWRPAFDIAEVQVLAAYRRRGIGERLVLEISGSVPGNEPVVLTVDPDNTGARRLYQRVGFRDLLGFPVTSMYLPMNPQILMGLRHARDAGAAEGDE
jgi:ribosomal protein S18 acetylase RimI-like enzyme